MMKCGLRAPKRGQETDKQDARCPAGVSMSTTSKVLRPAAGWGKLNHGGVLGSVGSIGTQGWGSASGHTFFDAPPAGLVAPHRNP